MDPLSSPTERLPRQEASLRVSFTAEGVEAEGWTLNTSLGGLRAVVFGPRLLVGERYDVAVAGSEPRPCRVVWLREEQDGQIAGVEFTA